MKVIRLLPIIPPLLIALGFGLMILSRHNIKRICEKYPIEIQMRDFPNCVRYGGPWPQKTNNSTRTNP